MLYPFKPNSNFALFDVTLFLLFEKEDFVCPAGSRKVKDAKNCVKDGSIAYGETTENLAIINTITLSREHLSILHIE